MNGNKIDNKGGMAIAGALQVNTILDDIDLAETDLVRLVTLSLKGKSGVVTTLLRMVCITFLNFF